MKTFAIVNQQPGSGKTTTAVNLAAALAKAGKKTLLVDLDPAAVATCAVGCPAACAASALITAESEAADTIIETQTPGLSLLPAGRSLAAAEYHVTGLPGSQFMLAEQLHPIARKYDICVIDCPATLGPLTINAMVAAAELIIPIPHADTDFHALDALLDIVKTVKARFSPCNVRTRGILRVCFENKTQPGKAAQRRIARGYKPLLLNTIIHKVPALADVRGHAASVLDHSPRSKGATEYRALARELTHGK